MSRAGYIYLIYHGTNVISAHTVKYEAHQWLIHHSPWGPDDCYLIRIRDGVHWKNQRYQKEMAPMEWDEKLIEKYRANTPYLRKTGDAK